MLSLKQDKTWIAVTAGVAYGLMLLVIWSQFAMSSGLAWETSFTVESERSHGTRGFFYGDILRVYESIFYHLGYLLRALWG